jgi:hypothetical protein
MDKRVSETPNYQGEKEGFISLNNAIWKMAVEDEFKKAKGILFGHLQYEIVRINGKKIQKETIQKAIDIVSPELLKDARKNIYKESQKWPDNSRKAHSYGMYKAAALGIVTELMKGEC